MKKEFDHNKKLRPRDNYHSLHQGFFDKKSSDNSDDSSSSERVYTFDPSSFEKKQSSDSPNMRKKFSSAEYEMQMEEIDEYKLSEMMENMTNKSMLFSQDNSNLFPSLFLQHSDHGSKPLKVKIPMYKTQTFMKMETQIFLLDVTDSEREFQVERRFSQFYDLYEYLFYNQPGYILCPFPDKSFTSFFKIKFGLGMGENQEKCEILERRMAQLQKFINYLTHHPSLRNSQEISIFLNENQSQFQKGMKRLQKYVEQCKNMEKKSQIKNIYGFGKSLLSSYFKKEETQAKNQMIKIGKNDIQFSKIEENYISLQQKLSNKVSLMKELLLAEKSFSVFRDFNTDNDFVLKVCSKHSSGKEYCKKLTNFIEIKILDELIFIVRTLEEVEKVLSYRKRIKDALNDINSDKEQERKHKLQRRKEILETIFLSEWAIMEKSIEERTQRILEDFKEKWKEHQSFMQKIWKQK